MHGLTTSVAVCNLCITAGGGVKKEFADSVFLCIFVTTNGAGLEGSSKMAEELMSGDYEAPALTVLGTLSELTMGSSLNILGDALGSAAASIISII
jgi:hypothetical protein